MLEINKETLFQNLEDTLEDLWSQFQLGALSKGDVVSLFLISLNEIFPIPNWLVWSRSREHSFQNIESFFYPKKHPSWERHLFFKKVPTESSLGEIMNQSLFKKETLRSSQGLVHIFNQPQTIHVLDYVPTPRELLKMQSEGMRCVTLLRSRNWFEHTFEHRRNLRDFIIHDLEHIWQMFEHPEMTSQQIQFSKKLYEMTENGQFDFLINDPQHVAEFNYIISDMNTHPAHMYATLKSLILRQKIQTQEILTPLMSFIPEDYLVL